MFRPTACGSRSAPSRRSNLLETISVNTMLEPRGNADRDGSTPMASQPNHTGKTRLIEVGQRETISARAHGLSAAITRCYRMKITPTRLGTAPRNLEGLGRTISRESRQRGPNPGAGRGRVQSLDSDGPTVGTRAALATFLLAQIGRANSSPVSAMHSVF